jgi:hypothetical protein
MEYEGIAVGANDYAVKKLKAQIQSREEQIQQLMAGIAVTKQLTDEREASLLEKIDKLGRSVKFHMARKGVKPKKVVKGRSNKEIETYPSPETAVSNDQ